MTDYISRFRLLNKQLVLHKRLIFYYASGCVTQAVNFLLRKRFPLGRMAFPRATPSGKPSSLGETFHHVTPTGMAYLYSIALFKIKCEAGSIVKTLLR